MEIIRIPLESRVTGHENGIMAVNFPTIPIFPTFQLSLFS